MSVLKWEVNSSSNFALFFIVMTHNSSSNFRLIPFLLCTKGFHQGPIFVTFKCSGGNLLNYSCHFPSNKSVFLKILHHSSMLLKITPVYFFSSNNVCFAQKDPIKVKILETFECSGQHLPDSLCQFWNGKSISLQILYPSSVLSLRLLSAQVKICQISYVRFERTSWFLSKFCIPLHPIPLLCIF